MLGICWVSAACTSQSGTQLGKEKISPCPPALIIWEGKMCTFGEMGRSLDPEWIYSNSEKTTWGTSSWRARWLPPPFKLCTFLECLPLTIYKSSQTGSQEPDWFLWDRWLVPVSQTEGSHVQPQPLRMFSTDGQCPVPLRKVGHERAQISGRLRRASESCRRILPSRISWLKPVLPGRAVLMGRETPRPPKGISVSCWEVSLKYLM